MPVNQFSIQWRITWLVGLCLLAIVVVLTLLSLQRMSDNNAQIRLATRACSRPKRTSGCWPKAGCSGSTCSATCSLLIKRVLDYSATPYSYVASPVNSNGRSSS